MKSSLKNQSGFMGAMLVIAIAAVVGIMIVGITQKMGDLTKSYDKNRAFFDSEIAIEKFSTSLKSAYDRANYLTDLRPVAAGASAAANDYGCPGKITTITGPSGGAPVRLCWEFSTLCTKRSSGSGVDICINSGNLQVRMKTPDEWEVAVQPIEKSTEEQWALVKAATIEYIKGWSIQEAHANLDVFHPPMPALTSTNSIAINMGAAVRNRPEAPDCNPIATNPFQCLKVSFCVKNGTACAPNEVIQQTYLFTKPAPTTQGW